MSGGRRWVAFLALALVAGGYAAVSPRPEANAGAAIPWAAPRLQPAQSPVPWAAPHSPAASPGPADEATAAAGPVSPGPVTPAPSPAPPCQSASLADRAGRVLLVGLPDVTSANDPLLAELADVGVGGVLLTHTNVVSERQVTNLVGTLKTTARGPLVVSADEEPGRVRSFEDLIGFVPSARRLANERTPDEVRDLGRTTGQVLARVGVTVDLAPVADLDDGPREATIGDRSFSADPVKAGDYALAYARGLQDAGVTPVVKHFPGHGKASGDDHTGDALATTPIAALMETDVAAFRGLVNAGAPVVMMGNVVYEALDPDAPASMSPAAYRLLRSLGFQGAAITDSIGMGAVNLRWDYGEATVKALAAGADGVLGTDGWGARWMRDAVIEAVQDGRLPEARLNEAAARMTTLAGGDPQALACSRTDLPTLR